MHYYVHLFQYNFYLNMLGRQSHLARSSGLKQIEQVKNDFSAMSSINTIHLQLKSRQNLVCYVLVWPNPDFSRQKLNNKISCSLSY